MSTNLKALLAISVTLLIVACGPQNRHQNGNGNANTNSNSSAGSNAGPNANATVIAPPSRGPGLRRVCADDIQKYCANDPKKGRCLRDNYANLEAACKAALDERRNHNREERENNGQANPQNNGGQQGDE
jgi:hypothetical protein